VSAIDKGGRMPRTRRTPKRAGDWKPAFLQAFLETGLIVASCDRVGIGRTTAYEARQQDEEFALAWADIEERVTEQMEAELKRRAVDGVEKPVFQGGRHVGSVQEYSDTLLIFALKARRPEKYRENVRVEHGGTVRHEGLEALSDRELLAKLAE